jgi:hypothetical protein
MPVVNDLVPVVGEEPELVPVTFNVGFSKEVIPLRSSSSSDFMPQYLDYYLFFHNGYLNLIKSNTIINSDGSFEDELPIGMYMIVFVGHNSGDVSIIEEVGDVPDLLNPIHAYQLQVLEEDGHVADQFYQKLLFSVRYGEENNVEVTLERNVGKVEIVLDEVIPSEVTEITLSVPFYHNKYYFAYDNDKGGQWLPINGVGVADFYKRVIPVPEEYKSKKGFTISFLSYEPASDSGIGPYCSITLNNKVIPVVVKKNKTMRYTGKLFEVADTPTPFTLTVEDDWEAPNDITF